MFPIYLDKTYSTPFGFCPAKATWDEKAMRVFEMMRTCLTTKTLWEEGGLGDQPSWFYDIYKDFAPTYQSFKNKTMWGSNDSKPTGQNTKNAKNKAAVGRQASPKRGTQ